MSSEAVKEMQKQAKALKDERRMLVSAQCLHLNPIGYIKIDCNTILLLLCMVQNGTISQKEDCDARSKMG